MKRKKFFNGRKMIMAAVLGIGLLVSGCGAKKEIDAEKLVDDLVTEIDYEDDLQKVDLDVVDMYIELPEKVDCVMYMGSGVTTEAVAVFTAPDNSTAKDTMENVQTYLDDQVESNQDYLPAEAKRAANAVLEQKNKYVILCVSGDSDKAKEIIEKAFK